MPTLKSEKVQRKIDYKSNFAILTLQTLLYKRVYVFFLETSVSESMGDLKGRGYILTL